METLHGVSSLAGWNKSLSLPCPSEAHCHSASHKYTHTHTQQQQQMDFELRGSLFSLHYRWRAAPSLSVNGIKWHWLLLLFVPMIAFPCRFPEAHREGQWMGVEGYVACQSWTLPALLATARPSHSLLQPARSSCHGSQVFPTLLMTHRHPLRAPPRRQHYPHLLHYYALLYCCF